MEMTITFDGKKKIIADYHGHMIVTDQPVEAGGDGSAPAPFDLFLASIGTCAGVYVLYFCHERGIDTTGLKVRQRRILAVVFAINAVTFLLLTASAFSFNASLLIFPERVFGRLSLNSK